MIDCAPLRELRELLAAFLERPLSGALVLGCRDDEMLHLVHTLDTLDTDSPADRFLLQFDPFITPESYVDQLVAHVAALTSRPPVPAGQPIARLRALLADLLSDLPAGDHRLLVALLPRRIADHAAFSSFAEALLAHPHPSPLRLVLRDDLDAPRHLLSAEACPSEQIVAYRFRLPASAVTSALANSSSKPDAPPDVRVQVLLQRAALYLTQRQHAEAVAACDAAVALAESPVLLAIALTFRANALRARGALEPAAVNARAALAQAIACDVGPMIHHAAMTLGELSRDLHRHDDAAACFALAERSAPHNPELQALARERGLAVHSECVC